MKTKIIKHILKKYIKYKKIPQKNLKELYDKLHIR